ncbi:cupin domain-containing protein [Enterobacter sp. BRE11]|nr:cupin domain-containing protein [Enterobacter sp. BRE11]
MVSKENAEHYIWGDQCDGWALLQRQDLSIIHERMPASTTEICHYHAQCRQFFFVLRGTLCMELEGECHLLHPHEGLEIPPEAKHQARNDSESDVEFLVISQPTTRGDRIDLL